MGNAARPKEAATIPQQRHVTTLSIIPTAQAQEFFAQQALPTITVAQEPVRESGNYKVTRLREMAAAWKGTSLEKMTVPLLAMLLVENGAMSEDVRGDHGYAIGLDQTHLCKRGFQGRKFCGSNAEKRVEEAFAGTEWANWTHDWRVQFRYYTEWVMDLERRGYSADDIIRSWNSQEAGRRGKVRSNEPFVQRSIR